jgi:hypothetical protein
VEIVAAMTGEDGNGAAVARRQRVLTLLFGDNPTGAERLAYQAMFSIAESLPDLVDLSDEELREALQTTLLRVLGAPGRR